MVSTLAINRDIDEVDTLLSEYSVEVRPLLVDIISRQPNRQIPGNLANEIRALNDHIARCFIDGKTSENNRDELNKAKGHLKRIEYDVYKQMNIFMHDKTIGEIELKRYEQMEGWHTSRWSGDFKNQYYDLKRKAIEAVYNAKLLESSGEKKDSVLLKYKEGFKCYRDLEELMKKHENDFIRLVRKEKVKKFCKILEAILIVLVTSGFSYWLYNIFF